MTIEERIRNRKIGIVGIARSGLAAAALADSYGGKPFVSDSKDAALLGPNLERLKASGIPFETGGHTERLLENDYLVVSPGVPPTIDILNKARVRGIPVFSEIEFAYWACKGKIIAITGSNGKTTTTTLIGEIFTAAGFDTFIGGNIGLPFSDIVQKIPENGIAVIEVSNFQLETIEDFAPDTALILNLTPDHLDRHGTFENYKKAKYRITENQTAEQSLILNLEDPEIRKDNVQTNATIHYFTTQDSEAATAFVRDGVLIGRRGNAEHPILPAKEILIPGPHNLQNASAAVCAAMQYDVAPEVIAGVLRKFPGVEHRMEKVGRVAGINFVNDSKATNVDSVCYALRSVDGQLYLIAGGRDKGADFAPLIELGKGKIKGILAIGEAREKVFNQLGHAFPVQFAESLGEAVRLAFEMAFPGETVLLSPGCASFDQFENYEHRGKVFKAAVADLKNGKNENETITKN
ncbi:MAG TPA: UDP-N-acetylmuramoyl-L-alanine--D-glutamate ligase [candidate division Zixibacteria bacterium]|nr:UDP-N-acetylmuramoyl-L-alanine--D-glutamate ligase [candidate division Zixibacteria bacterium]